MTLKFLALMTRGAAMPLAEPGRAVAREESSVFCGDCCIGSVCEVFGRICAVAKIQTWLWVGDVDTGFISLFGGGEIM